MINKVYGGDIVQVIAGGNTTSGLPIEAGELFGVPASSVSSGAPVALAIEGVFDLVKQGGAGVTFAIGDPVYWDNGNGRATSAANSGFSRIGVCTATAADAATTVRVLLNGEARPEEYITVCAVIPGLYAAGAATTSRSNVALWKNKTGRSVKLIAASFRQVGAIEFASDANDTYAISLGRTGAVSVVAAVTYDDSPALPALTANTAMTVITAASANVFAADEELFATGTCAINDAAKMMPFIEIQATFQVL
jgi:predicted RecA/RadA family phage recombinase